jgi:outer membrane protein
LIRAAPLCRVLLLAGLLPAPAAWGQSAGDTVVQAGWTHLAIADARTRRVHTQVDESARGLVLPAEFDSAGLGLRPEPADTLGLAVRHFLTDTIAVELDLGLPPTIEARGSGVATPPGPAGAVASIDLGDPAHNPLGEQRQWTPVLALQYRFRPGATVRPFVLAGVSYTWFSHTRVNPAFERRLDERFGQYLATNAGKPGPTRAVADTESLWLPVAAAGAEWLPGGRWSLGATVGYARPALRPSLAIVASDGTVLSRTQAEVQVDSMVVALGVGYRFRLRD